MANGSLFYLYLQRAALPRPKLPIRRAAADKEAEVNSGSLRGIRRRGLFDW